MTLPRSQPRIARLARRFAEVVAALALLIVGSRHAAAHPHVFVTTESVVVIENGTITAIEQKWIFDELYTAMAIQGLDKNGDGKYDREELAELAKINMEGLKEFAYFTYPRLKEAALKVGEVKEAWLEHTGGILSLHFRLPLLQPVAISSPGFSFMIADPSFYIAFEPAKANAVRLSAGSPKECTVEMGGPPTAAAEEKRLADAFAGQLGGGAAVATAGGGAASVKCSS